PAIGAALGHRDGESTAIYFRLAIDDLRDVGLPVPKGGSATVLERRHWKQRLVPARDKPRARPIRTGFRSGLAESLRRFGDDMPSRSATKEAEWPSRSICTASRRNSSVNRRRDAPALSGGVSAFLDIVGLLSMTSF